MGLGRDSGGRKGRREGLMNVTPSIPRLTLDSGTSHSDIDGRGSVRACSCEGLDCHRTSMATSKPNMSWGIGMRSGTRGNPGKTCLLFLFVLTCSGRFHCRIGSRSQMSRSVNYREVLGILQRSLHGHLPALSHW